MIYRYYPMILGIIDTLNELNEKLDRWASDNMDSLWFGVGAVGVIIVVSFWGIGALNKRQ